MKAVFSIILFSTIVFVSGQSSSFIRTYGGSDFNYGKGILALQDTSYIICGNRSFNGSIGSIWLFRVDSLGSFMWEDYINHYDAAVVEDIGWYNDTSFIICGTIFENGDYQAYVAKYSINGHLIWEATVGTPSWDYANSIVSDSAYHLWMTGYTMPYDTFDTDAFIYKLDGQNGDSLDYFRIDSAYIDMGMHIDTFASYLVFIAQQEDINSDSSTSTVTFMDKTLIPKWTLSFGNDSVDYNLYCSDQDTYHRLWVGGGYQHDTSSTEKHYYNLIDTSGIVIYEVYGGPSSTKHINNMVITNQSEVYNIGSTVDGFLNYGNSDFGLTYNYSGIGGVRYYGELQDDYGEDLAITYDRGIVMIGSTESYASNASSILLIKVDSTLVYNDSDYIHYAAIGENSIQNMILAYPNPSNGQFFFKTDFKYSNYIIVDMYGRVIKQGTELIDSQVNLASESPGIYFISFYSQDEIRTIKLFLQK